MTFESYASSSAGNLYSITDGKSTVLIECGLPKKKLLKAIDFNLLKINACLLSHSHGDHAKSAQELVSDGVRVYMSEGTANELKIDSAPLVAHLEQFSIGTFDIIPFDTFHDAKEPLGFLVKSKVDGDIFVFATDTVNLRYKFPGINILAIEANYDKSILARSEKLPEKVRHRIENAHMEIDTLCEYLKTLDLSTCREIYLLHLSNAMSNEWQFKKRVEQIVPPHTRVTVCQKETRGR